MRIIHSYKEFVRFCIVGILCTLLDAFIFYALRTSVQYPVALVCAYLLSLCCNYILTVYWTFRSQPSKRNAIGVIAAHLFNLFIVRMGIMWFFTNIIMMSDRMAYIPTIIISTCLNFTIIRFVIHKYN